MWNPRRNQDRQDRCPVCGATRARSMGLIQGYEVVRCRRCGLGRARVPDVDLRSFYDEAYFRGEKARYAQAEDEELTPSKRYWLDRFVPAGGTSMLELGPGPGAGVCRYLASSRPGMAYEAVDVSATVVEALGRRDIPCHHGAIHDPEVMGACEGRFDAVVAVEVIEHDPSPGRFAAGCFAALRPGGTLSVTTGNLGGLVARVQGRRWYYFDPPAHLFYYTTRSIRRLLGDAGFDPVEIRYTGFRYIERYLANGVRATMTIPHLLRMPTGMTVVAHRPR